MNIVHNQIVFKDKCAYSAFPCIERCANGDLLVAFRKAPREQAVHHFHSQSKAVVVRSSDEGKTWSEPKEILPDCDLAQQDPHLTRLGDGKILMTAFTWQFHALCEKDALTDVYMEIGETKGGIMRCAGIVSALSLDDGLTWRFQDKIKPAGAPRNVWANAAMHTKAAVLPDGGILLPCRVESRAGYYEYLIRSDDDGQSWCYVTEIVRDTSPRHHHYYDECFIQRLADGRLFCFLRCYDEGGLMEVCTSGDDGQSWSKPVLTTVWGFPQSTLRLSDDRILLTYGYRRAPYGVRMKILDPLCSDIDQAEESVVYAVSQEQADGIQSSTDLGYPSGIQLADGSILIVYYCYDLNDRTSHIRATIMK